MSGLTDGLFKHIPCPNGDACTAIRCLFAHRTDTPDPPPPSFKPPASSLPSPNPPVQDAPNTSRPPSTTMNYPQQPTPPGPYPFSPNGYRVPFHSPSYSQYGYVPRGADSNYAYHQYQPSLGQTVYGYPSPPKQMHQRPLANDVRTTPVTTRHIDASLRGIELAGAATGPREFTTQTTAQTSSATSTTSTATYPASAAGPSVTNPKAHRALPKRKAENLNPRHVPGAPAQHATRARLLVLLHQEFVRLNKMLLASKDMPERRLCVLTEQGLIWAALDMEEQYARTKSAKVYADTVKHCITSYRRMTLEQWVSERKEAREAKEKAARERRAAAGSDPTPAAPSEPVVSAPSSNTLPKRRSAAIPIVAPPPPLIKTGLPAKMEYVILAQHLLTKIEGLEMHGYVTKVPSAEDIQKAREADEANQGFEQCDRCESRFQVFPGRRESDGVLASGGLCSYHHGRFNRSTQLYTCCHEAPAANLRCTEADSHVFKHKDVKRMAALWNFVETPPNPNARAFEAVCFDCEMAYTVNGMEVVRLTVTAWPASDETLLDVLVRPKGQLMDLNSRFSGIWPADLAMAVPFHGTSAKDAPKAVLDPGSGRPVLPIVDSPEAARALFFSLIRPETVLIGHALENDLNTMRMIHTRVCDTALLFPHNRGLPLRNSLKYLANTHLDRAVQVAGAAGHDSAEDARAAGDLVRVKVKEKWAHLKTKGYRLEGDTIVTPNAAGPQASPKPPAPA